MKKEEKLLLWLLIVCGSAGTAYLLHNPLLVATISVPFLAVLIAIDIAIGEIRKK